MRPRKYQVIVGNIGTVYDGNSATEANKYFRDYRLLSLDETSGRASGEVVTLLKNSHVHKEHTPPVKRPFTFGIVYLETCLPCYCNGYNGHMLAINLWPKIRTGDVRRRLIEEIHADDMFGVGYSIDMHDAVQEVIHEDWAIEQMVESVREMFRNEDGRKTWSRFPLSHESYAYFGVTVEVND